MISVKFTVTSHVEQVYMKEEILTFFCLADLSDEAFFATNKNIVFIIIFHKFPSITPSISYTIFT